jgi:hypothetical protein
MIRGENASRYISVELPSGAGNPTEITLYLKLPSDRKWNLSFEKIIATQTVSPLFHAKPIVFDVLSSDERSLTSSGSYGSTNSGSLYSLPFFPWPVSYYSSGTIENSTSLPLIRDAYLSENLIVRKKDSKELLATQYSLILIIQLSESLKWDGKRENP